MIPSDDSGEIKLMKMDLSKIDEALCFAMQYDEGPFYIRFISSNFERPVFLYHTRNMIKFLSNRKCTISISLVSPPQERRALTSQLMRSSLDRRGNVRT